MHVSTFLQKKFKKSFRIESAKWPHLGDKREPRCSRWIGDKREPIPLLLRDMRVQFGLGPAPLILSIPTTYTAALRANTDPPGP